MVFLEKNPSFYTFNFKFFMIVRWFYSILPVLKFFYKNISVRFEFDTIKYYEGSTKVRENHCILKLLL